MLLTQLELFLDWCKQLVDAEKFLLQHGVLHLDMKLKSILVSEDQVLKIGGFGSAMQLPPSSLQREFFKDQTFGGNIAHLAPEVMNTVQKASKNSTLHSMGRHQTFQESFLKLREIFFFLSVLKCSSDTMHLTIEKYSC